MDGNFVYWIIFLPFVIWFWVSFLIPRHKTCPDCAQPLSPFQSPFTKTKRMWFEGGYLCSNCGCEVNMDGHKVPAGTAPQQRSITRGIGLLLIMGLPALIMLYTIFQYTPVPQKLVVVPQKLIAVPVNAARTR